MTTPCHRIICVYKHNQVRIYLTNILYIYDLYHLSDLIIYNIIIFSQVYHIYISKSHIMYIIIHNIIS